jgi:hypothetical protein
MRRDREEEGKMKGETPEGEDKEKHQKVKIRRG